MVIPEVGHKTPSGVILAMGQGLALIEEDGDGNQALNDSLRAELIGRTAWYVPGSGHEVTVGSERFIIISADDLLGTAAL